LKIEELWYSIYFISLPYSTEDVCVSITAVDNKLNAIEMKTTAEGEASANWCISLWGLPRARAFNAKRGIADDGTRRCPDCWSKHWYAWFHLRDRFPTSLFCDPRAKKPSYYLEKADLMLSPKRISPEVIPGFCTYRRLSYARHLRAKS